jgi:hypothetical protein
MPSDNQNNERSPVHEIKKKIRQLNLIISFIIITLIAVIVRYLYEPVASSLQFLPDVSVTLIVGSVFLLSLIGLYLSTMLTRQTVRIIEEYSRKLEKLLSITNDLREEVHSDILLDKIMDFALTLTQSEAGSILLLDKRGSLIFKIMRGEDTKRMLGRSVDVGKGITGWVAEKGLPLRLIDVSRDERFDPDIDAMGVAAPESILCVPLKTKSGIIGVLKLLNRKDGHPFREREEQIITYLAGQAAISITKTQFYEDQRNYEIHLTEMLLEAIDIQIPEMSGHSRRVATYSNIIAKSLQMPEEKKRKLHFACLLHDVGFLKISSDDVFKQEQFMKHPVLGYEMISPINFYADIAPFILHHHERYDGFGYPSGLKGEETPLEARIISVAEAFDAMINEPTYKVPVNFEQAKQELVRNAGTQFDPRIVEVFVGAIEPDLMV